MKNTKVIQCLRSLNTILFWCLILFICTNETFSQDLETIKKEKPFAMSGSIGLNYSTAFNDDSTQLPMPNYWNINGQVNFKIYGMMIPLNFVYSNGVLNLENAFNQMGASPKYKWLTLHGGYRRMTFSPYTLANQTFLGAGAEINYKLLRFGGMFGRFNKAQRSDSLAYLNQIPGNYPVNFSLNNGQNQYSPKGSFSRTGYAVKLGIGNDKRFFDLIYFKAKDRENSISDSLTRAKLKPEENFGLGVSSLLTFLKHYKLGFTAATSVYTYDTSADSLGIGNDIPLANVLQKVIKIRSTTQLQWAGEVNGGIHYDKFSITAQYKQIEPYYRSMGIVSFLSDLKSLSISPSFSLFKGKMNFTNNFMFMHDNLNKYKQFTTYRNNYNSSISINPSSKFGIDLSYSGYTLNQKNARENALDSMRIEQNSHSYSVIPHWFVLKTKASHSFVLVGSYTLVDGGSLANFTNKVQNIFGTFNYSTTFLKSSLGLTTGLNFNQSITTLNTLNSIGLTGGISKPFWKNMLTISNNNSFLLNALDGKNIGATYTIDLSLGFSFPKGHSFSLAAGYVTAPANGIYNDRDFSQLRLSFAYRYQFGKL